MSSNAGNRRAPPDIQVTPLRTVVEGVEPFNRPVRQTFAELFAEAFRFLNYPDQQAWLTKTNWLYLNSDTLIRCLAGARLGLHDLMLRRIGRLATREVLGNVLTTLPQRRGATTKEDLVDFVLIGRYVVSALSDASARSAKATDAWDSASLATASMKTMLSPAELHATLVDVFGSAMPSAPDVWGSAVTVRELRSSGIQGQEGLTERLYRGLRHPVIASFRSRSASDVKEIKGVSGSASFRLHLQVRSEVKRLVSALGITRSVPHLEWLFAAFDCLDALERTFGHPLEADHNQGAARNIAIRLGFPWALVLIAAARAFLAHAAMKIQFSSLPLREIYDTKDSLTAIALLENLIGKPLPSQTVAGYSLPELAKVNVLIETDLLFPGGRPEPASELLVALKERTPKFATLIATKLSQEWETISSEVHAFALLADKLSAYPVLLAREYEISLKKWLEAGGTDPFPHETSSISLEAFASSLPRLGSAIHIPGARFPYDAQAIQFYMCADHKAQVHLYAASAILRVAIDELALQPPWMKDGNGNRRKQHRPCPQCGHIAGRRHKALPERCDDGVVSSLQLPTEIGLSDLHDALPTDDELSKWRLPTDRAELSEAQQKWRNHFVDWQGRARASGAATLGPVQFLAGSYPWGGCMPPHQTHQDGATFDVRFGPDTQEWSSPGPFQRELETVLIPRAWPAIARQIALSCQRRSALPRLPQHEVILEEWQALEHAIVVLTAVPLTVLDASYSAPKEDTLRAVRDFVRTNRRTTRNQGSEAATAASVVLRATRRIPQLVRRALGQLLAVRLDGRDTHLNPDETARVFRGFLRDRLDLHQNTFMESAARGQFLPPTTESASWDVPGELAAAEAAMLGTPHHESLASRQWAAVGHVAFLLTGPSQILYSSPLTHLRCLSQTLDALATVPDSGDVFVSVARDIGAHTRFIFMPHNHHDHWHIEYGSIGADRFDKLLWIWFELGIDLSPLLEYLASERAKLARRIVTPDVTLTEALKGLEAVIDKVNSYQRRYKEEYLLDERAFVRFVRARRRLYAVLLRFGHLSPALSPTRPNGSPSPALREAMRLTDDIFRAMLAAGSRIPRALFRVGDSALEGIGDGHGEPPDIDEERDDARESIELLGPEVPDEGSSPRQPSGVGASSPQPASV